MASKNSGSFLLLLVKANAAESGIQGLLSEYRFERLYDDDFLDGSINKETLARYYTLDISELNEVNYICSKYSDLIERVSVHSAKPKVI